MGGREKKGKKGGLTQVEAKKKMYTETKAIDARCEEVFVEKTAPVTGSWPVDVVPRTATRS